MSATVIVLYVCHSHQCEIMMSAMSPTEIVGNQGKPNTSSGFNVQSGLMGLAAGAVGGALIGKPSLPHDAKVSQNSEQHLAM